MFAAPQTLQTEVFARIPDRFRGHGRTSRWGDVQRQGAPTDCFIEGPSFDVDGNLFVVDIPYGRIFRIDPNANVELYCEYDGEPNGLKIHRDGRIFIADHHRGLMVLEPGTRRVTPVLERDAMDHFKGLTISSSRRTATSISPIRAAPDGRTLRAGCTGYALRATSSACSTTCQAPMVWC